MIIIGHRGARGLAKENSLEAISKALKLNVDIIEIDVRVTKDSIPILHHDPELNINGRTLSIAKNNLKVLHDFDEDLMTLSQALDKIESKVLVYIEVKPKVDIKPIVKTIKSFLESGMYGTNNILLASKSQKTLLGLHKALPNIKKVVIEPWSGVRAHIRSKQVGTKTISMNQLWLWSGFIKSVSRSGYELYAYTLNDAQKAARWEKYGLSGVVTDFPDRFEKK